MVFEWSGCTQLLSLLQSTLAGALLGVAFSVFTGWGRSRQSAMARFVLDVTFMLLAALATFFASLVIMDGQLHPLLFGGLVLGAAVEHILIGRWISAGVCRLLVAIRKVNRIIRGWICRFGSCFLNVRRFSRGEFHKNPKKVEKNTEIG